MVDDPVRLRQQATELRRVASALARVDAGSLCPLAGVATWVGPTAEVCRSWLATSARRLSADIVDLRRRAAALEQRAALLG